MTFELINNIKLQCLALQYRASMLLYTRKEYYSGMGADQFVFTDDRPCSDSPISCTSERLSCRFFISLLVVVEFTAPCALSCAEDPTHLENNMSLTSFHNCALPIPSTFAEMNNLNCSFSREHYLWYACSRV